MSYRYRITQGRLEITYSLPCEAPEHLLTVLTAFFYAYRSEAALEPPRVFQDRCEVLEDQVAAEFEKLKLFMKDRRIVR